jgi:hypothetical protein
MVKMIPRNEGFTCEKCGNSVDPVKYGGSYRNHCPDCLYSKHVDADIPGDRASSCGGLMAPIGVFTRRTGEHVLVHRCENCGLERFNRIAGDDDFTLVTKLSTVPVRKGKNAHPRQ